MEQEQNPYRSTELEQPTAEDQSGQAQYYGTALILFVVWEAVIIGACMAFGLKIASAARIAAVSAMATGPVSIVAAAIMAERETPDAR